MRCQVRSIHPVNNAQTFWVTVRDEDLNCVWFRHDFCPSTIRRILSQIGGKENPIAGLSGERVSKEISKRGLCAPQRAPALPFIRRTARR